MRILILALYYDPEPVPKPGELARELIRRGHTVNVVTAFPNYPAGRLYPGYRLALWRREVRDGVALLRTFTYPYHGTSVVLRIANYVSWMVSAMLAAWLTPRCDVIYVWHPPLTVGVTAWVLGRVNRAPFVYDVQDLWPEGAVASGYLRPGPIVSLLHWLADWVYARAARILVVSRAAADQLRGRGVNPAKIQVAAHWIDDSIYAAPPSGRDIRSEYGLDHRFIVMFAGNLGIVQGLDTVIEAAARLRNDPEAVFVLVGDGSDRQRLESMAAARGLTNVRFVGRHPASAMPDFLRAADALLVQLRPSEISDQSIPTKVLAYLAAGRPIICGVPGVTAELVGEADAGISVEPGNVGALVAATRRLRDLPREAVERLGANGRRYFAEHFDRARIIDEYEAVLREVASA